ncbi:hypothetical protein DV736_g705, partial [Chaetothyriales sp. CBS 134916]
MGPSLSYSVHGLSREIRLHNSSTDERRPLLSSHPPLSSVPPKTDGVAGRAPSTHSNLDDEDVEEDESEHADSNGLYPPNLVWTTADGRSTGGKRPDPFHIGECNIYTNIHRIRRDIRTIVDDPYSLDQLKTPRLNTLVVRPLVHEYYATQDLSIVYCLLVNRMQFIRDQSFHSHHQTVNLTRALLCELLAEKILRRYNENWPGPKGLLKLANILVAGFEPFQNAPEEVIREAKELHPTQWSIRDQADADSFGKLTALEVAIITESKSFLASNACQKVIDAIYKGKVVYPPNCNFAIISDPWKLRPISLYDPCRAPVLNQYRLNVPRIRKVLEIFQFVILLVLYMLVMEGRETRMTTQYSLIEAVFDVYTVGWVLDQFAAILEHGWQVYTQNLWSFLDVIFSAVFITYLVMRLHGLVIADEQLSATWARAALDVLCCGAPLLVPRLAFNLMAENMLFVSLRAMMSDFLTLTLLAVWCFVGFLLSLKWLDNGLYHPLTISKWIIWIWFGLDGTGIDKAPDFHWLLGPILMILFAFLSNTLFLTILVSMLTNTFSNIVNNAVQEIQYRRAVQIFEGVHFDAIFAYMPPFNLVALVVMLPLRAILTPHMFHTVNVACIRVINFPTLLAISWYERRTLWVLDKRNHLWWTKVDWNNPFGPRARTNGSWWMQKLKAWKLSRFSAHGALQVVFDLDPPPSAMQTIDGQGQGDDNTMGGQISSVASQGALSTLVLGDFKDPFSLNRHSESEANDHDESDAPQRAWKPRRSKRLDSIIDMNDSNPTGTQETNTRLSNLEESMQRIEAMIGRLGKNQAISADADEDLDPEDGEMTLEQEIATGTVPD